MGKLVKIVSFLLISLMLTSCGKEKSLQSYLVESGEKKDFTQVDIPLSLLFLVNKNTTDMTKEVMKSVKKINFTFFKKTPDNQEVYQSEKSILKNIFANRLYKNIANGKVKEMRLHFYYTGETERINEVIVFGCNEKKGLSIIRLLGDDMNMPKILEMITDTRLNLESIDLSNFKAVF